MITHTVTRTVARWIFANRSKVLPPIREKLLLTLRPYAYGEDVILDDIYGNTGEDVNIEWRGRYGEDVPIVGYMIPEDMQAEIFAILGKGLWFDADGTAKQVNVIELAQSPEINQWAVWYRLDYAAGIGRREVCFYDPATLTENDVAKIAAWFKANISSKRLIPIRVNRTSKPPIGTPLRSDGHWSVLGLVGAWAFNEGWGGSVIDGVSGAITQISGSLAGGKYTLNGTSDYMQLPVQPVQSSPDLTILIKAKSSGQMSGIRLMVGNWTGPSSSNYGFFWYDSGGTLDLSFLYGSNGNIHATNTFSNVNTMFAASCNQGGGDLYVSGEKIATITGDMGTIYNSTDIWYVGYFSSGNYYWGGEVDCLLKYNSKLSDQQIASLSANPWQIYEPETVWVEV